MIQKYRFIILISSIVVLLAGYLLTVNLIPIQDLETSQLSHQQKIELLNELAINYPLGNKLIILGIIMCSISAIIFGYNWLLAKFKK
ncbi:MAG: hypothetical protein LKF42_05180 [Streptococcaceae bacterium]|jgi:hypothetical protein|nr:hypothetical protein [Streptococcaceae bacterium]MCH4176861.1 hypothetical protein [Streptococcaceae bacterium]